MLSIGVCGNDNNKNMKKEIVCKYCGSNAVTTPKQGTAAAGLTFLIVGALLTLTVIGAIIGVPLMIVGFISMITAPFFGGFGKARCKNCKSQFKVSPHATK